MSAVHEEKSTTNAAYMDVKYNCSMSLWEDWLSNLAKLIGECIFPVLAVILSSSEDTDPTSCARIHSIPAK